MKKLNTFLAVALVISAIGCAHNSSFETDENKALKFDRKLVREAVVFENGTQNGAVVPEISAPRLRALWIPEKKENGRLIEAHREWLLEGDVSILGIPKAEGGKK